MPERGRSRPQRLFGEPGSPWCLPWFTRILPQVAALARRHPGRTVFSLLATVMSAIDLGYRIVLATDALCSVSDRTHDALITLYRERFSQQLTMAMTVQILEAWN